MYVQLSYVVLCVCWLCIEAMKCFIELFVIALRGLKWSILSAVLSKYHSCGCFSPI